MEKKNAAKFFLGIACLLNFVFCHTLAAQNSTSIVLRTFAAHDSVLLRWAPADADAWKAGIKNGYLIERYTSDEYFELAGQDMNGHGTLLTPAPLLPLPQNDTGWTRLKKQDAWNIFLFDALYNTAKIPDAVKQKQQEQMQFGLTLKACDLSVATAKAAALYFADKTAEPGKIYFYRVRFAGENKFTAGASMADPKIVLHAPENLGGDFRSKRATLSFDVSSTRAEFAGYIVERSDDSIHFSRVNKTLLVFAVSQYEQNKTQLVYQDSFPQNGKTYWYRVRGYSYFGMTGPPSNAVRGKGKDDWTAYPLWDTLYSPENKTAILRWHMPDSVLQSVASFFILRGKTAGGPYSNIGKTDRNAFSFPDPSPEFTSYYIIGAISVNGDTGFSFPDLLQLEDRDPPPGPVGVKGTIDTNGVVHLSWNPVSVSDLEGYRIFRANSLQEEAYEVSDSVLAQNFFTDTITLNTLTRNVIYFVRSVDRMYNNSENSAPCYLQRPDKIPPVAAVARSAVHTDSTIELNWINSSSADVMCVELRRDKTVLRCWNGKDTVTLFEDPLIAPGTVYNYELVVTDSSGNTSTTIFPAILFSPRIYPEINLQAQANLESRTISLSWKMPAQPVDRFIIYKSKSGEPFRAWKTVPGNSTGIVDRELYPGNIYRYKIKAVYRNGAESKVATTTEVNF